jgi:CRP/FNR family transcriptional regulator, cyclic AMP receptor protein
MQARALVRRAQGAREGEMDKREVLRQIPLFRALSDADLDEIADLLIERRYPHRATVFEEGSVGEYMYVIRDGEVKVSKMSDDGREKVLEMLGPGDFVGEMALLDRAPRSASVKATSDCVLLALSRNDFLGLLRRNPDISLELVRELARRLRETDEEVRGLLFERVEGRTRRVLRRMATQPAPGRPHLLITGSVTHQQLADLVGTSRETITRVVKGLKGRGWLDQEGKHYLIAKDEGSR